MKLITFVFCALLLANPATKNQDRKVIQFNISKILNARPVTTLANNKLTTWTKGIDGNGFGDGYLTLSAALFNGDKEPHALPDDPLIKANTQHPEIALNYSNNDSLHYQTCNIAGSGEIGFSVPKAKYIAIYLALTSSEGPSSLSIKLTYANGSEVKDYILPDYYNDLPENDPNICYLVHDLAKWGNKNNMTEKDHHNIDLLKIPSDPRRILKSITIAKTKPGYLVSWAAAGEKN